ncbi:MAG: hypothetical protein CMH56_07515 [Myxococcales bacterium]|nr:hypothetical protein [Myxococcales bacterium]|tara:strand:- start:2979 stop:4328 length:1350 start_codon:yes stop_codon:yes gene_type:complete
MTKKQRWAVLGSGYKGIVGAYLLAKQGHRVTIFDKSKKLGGVLNSIQREGYTLDLGCHLFDNVDRHTTSLVLELLDEEIVPVNVKYGAVMKDFVEGIATPDLRYLGEEVAENIVKEMKAGSQKTDITSENYWEAVKNRHGKTAADVLYRPIQKAYAIPPEKMSALAMDLVGNFGRIRVVNDEEGRRLKQDPWLDERIAVPSKNDPVEFYKDQVDIHEYRHFYPKENGLSYFCEKATEKLKAQGVSFLLGHSIDSVRRNTNGAFDVTVENETSEFDRILWGLPNEFLGDVFGVDNAMKDFIHPVPMILYYFFTDCENLSDYSYVQNYNDEHVAFRMSIPTNYGHRNAPDGKGYLCCEVPTPLDSELWDNSENLADRLWEEARAMGLVKDQPYDDYWTIKTPVSYKVPKKGYEAELERTLKKIPFHQEILGCGDWEYSKKDITIGLLASLN